MPIAELYPARPRELNVALIKAVRDAEGENQFIEANEEFAAALHPSIFAELDWMETSMPREWIEQGQRLVDDLFYTHLPGLLALRGIELDLDEEALLIEVGGNSEFYRYVVEEIPDALNGALLRKVRDLLRNFDKNATELFSQVERSVRASVADRIPEIAGYTPWIITFTSIEIRNSVLRALDHLSSRVRAKHFVRTIGGNLPSLSLQEIQGSADRRQFVEELRALADLARADRLPRLVAVCELIAGSVADINLSATPTFRGELIEGCGPCARCSMSFASSAIASLDPTCPGLFSDKEGTITVPLDFNVARCHFCGHEDRINYPSMFYSPQRNQVIYNVPTFGQYTQQEAVELHRPVIEALRERYLERVGETGAPAFENAAEELVYSVQEFMATIHMGTTVPEEHVYSLIRLRPSGKGLVVDKTKNVILILTESEVGSMWASSIDVPVTAPDFEADGALGQAMAAFKHSDYERAREILEELYRRAPSDQTRRNLAAAHYALGDYQEARRVLQN